MLSVCIIARDEERHIGAALLSAQGCGVRTGRFGRHAHDGYDRPDRDGTWGAGSSRTLPVARRSAQSRAGVMQRTVGAIPRCRRTPHP